LRREGSDAILTESKEEWVNVPPTQETPATQEELIARDTPPARLPWPQLLAGGAIIGGLAVDLLLGTERPHALFTMIGGPIVVAAILVNLWCARLLREHGTPIEANRPATELVVDGPYMYTRNPIYVCYVALVFGLGLALGSWTVTLLAPLVGVGLHFMSVLPEERHLQRKFSEKYAEWAAYTPRWVFR
jgi:protein-S-isoprenylcysteine O-methyltransferase Ste14